MSVMASLDYNQEHLAAGAVFRGIRSEQQEGTPLSAWGYTLQSGTYSVRVVPAVRLRASAMLGSPTITLTLH